MDFFKRRDCNFKSLETEDPGQSLYFAETEGQREEGKIWMVLKKEISCSQVSILPRMLLDFS